MPMIFVCFVLSFLISPQSFAQFEQSLFFYQEIASETLSPGVEWQKLSYDDLFGVKQEVNIVEIDLTQADVRPIALAGCGRVSASAESQGALAAVNGTFFQSNCQSRNFLKVDGKLYSDNAIRSEGSAALIINKQGQVRLQILKPGEDPSDAVHGIGGFPQLVQDGQVLLFPLESTSFFNDRHPRTGVGVIHKDRLLLLVVDGRSSRSRGFNLNQMAQYFYELGADAAMNLDGGGSSMMWVRGHGVVNTPSDGRERAVSDGLAIF